MPTKRGRKQWVFDPPKPKVTEEIKAEVQKGADEFVAAFLKPTFIKPPPEDIRWNYIVDIYTKWYRNYFYVCAKYRSPGPNAISEHFETRFTRLEFAGDGKFNMAFMRHTGQWVETSAGLSLEECLESIKQDPFYQP